MASLSKKNVKNHQSIPSHQSKKIEKQEEKDAAQNSESGGSIVVVVDLQKSLQNVKISNTKNSSDEKKQKLPRNGKLIRESDSVKIYTKYRCSSCGKEWWSSHGWTDYTQRCGKCGNTGMVIQRSRTAPNLENENSSRSAGKLLKGGGHNATLCEMCQDINRSCTRVNRVKVEEFQEGRHLQKKVFLIRNPADLSNVETYYRRYAYPSPTDLDWIYDYRSF